MHFRVDLHGRPEPCFEIARFRAMARVNGDQHSCAAFWVKGVAETLKAAELDVAALLDEAGYTFSNRKGQSFVATCGGAFRQPGDRALNLERRETGEL